MNSNILCIIWFLPGMVVSDSESNVNRRELDEEAHILPLPDASGKFFYWNFMSDGLGKYHGKVKLGDS